MYKYEITLTDKSVITATSSFSFFTSLGYDLENKLDFITIGDIIVRKADVLSVREVKDDE